MSQKKNNQPEIIDEDESRSVPAKLLLYNYSPVLTIIDEAMEIVAEALKQQMFTAAGKRKVIGPKNLYLITKSLALMKIVYKGERLINPPGTTAEKPTHGSYEDWIRAETQGEAEK